MPVALVGQRHRLEVAEMGSRRALGSWIGGVLVTAGLVAGCDGGGAGEDAALDAGRAMGSDARASLEDASGLDAPGLDAYAARPDAPGLDAPGLDTGGEDAASSVPTPRMEVRLDRPLVERDNEVLIRVAVTCVPHDAAGFVIPDPGDLRIRIEPAGGVEVEPGVFTFAARGHHVVTCASATLSLTGSTPLEVAHEGIDRNVIRPAAAGHRTGQTLADAIAAGQAGDEPAVRALAIQIAEVATTLPESRFGETHLLVPLPAGWPTAAEARAAGLGAGADDAAWASALAELEAAVAQERAALAMLPTTGELTDADARPYLDASARVHAAALALAPLSPSPAAMMESMASIDRLLADALPGAVREGASYFGEVFRTARVVPPSGSGLTLVEAVVSVAINTVVSEYSYTSVLKQLGAVALDNMTAFVVAGLIDDALPPGAEAPTILSAHGPAAAFVGAGRSWTARGERWDPPELDDYAVFFIHPEINGIFSDLVGWLDSARGVFSGNNPIQIAKNIHDIIRSFIDLAESTYGITDESRLVLYPEGISEGLPEEYFIDFPALPARVNCSFLPRVGTMIPVSRTRGRGPSYMVNVYQETCP